MAFYCSFIVPTSLSWGSIYLPLPFGRSKSGKCTSCGTVSVMAKPWQIMATAWASEIKNDSIGGKLLSNDCGVGKTVTALIIIYCRAQRIKNIPNQGLYTPYYRLTLILCPPSITEVWWVKYKKYFSTALTVKV